MKKLITLLVLLALNLAVAEAGITSQITVEGYAFLEDRQNHANIKVKFVPLSPSAVADSVYTNALGEFEINNLYPGVYSVHMSRPGFQTPLIHENLTLIEDTDLGETWLYDLGTTVSGNVSGVWSGFYSVSDNISVPAGDSLIIEAGTVIRLLGNFGFNVYGYLAANGAEGDSIRITSGPADQNQQPNQWLRLRFYESVDPNTYLNYTIVEYANDGVYIQGPGITVEHSTISRHQRYGFYFTNSDGTLIKNSTVQHCGTEGIRINASLVEIDNCTISHSPTGIYIENQARLNISNSYVGSGTHGIQAHSSSHLHADHCNISDNSGHGIYFLDVYSRGSVTNCTISSNSEGIYFRRNSHTLIEGNLITENASGILFGENCNPQISENKIINNTNGIRFNSSWPSRNCNPFITRNLIANNTHDGILKHTDGSTSNSPTITYNTITGNGRDGIAINRPGNETITNNIIAFNNGWGLRANEFVETFEYNNVYSNDLGEISNLDNMLPATWIFNSTNPNNNASCDIFRNINEDPMFAGTEPQFYALTYGSKCINGGSDDVTDPDGSVSDIGAFPFDHGNPHVVYATSFDDQQVTLEWNAVANDSIVDYKVYYRLSGSKTDYTFFDSTADTTIDVTGLTNNELYDFTVSGNYPSYESQYAPKVSEKPGIATFEYEPGSYSIIIPVASATVTKSFTINNPGTRDLHVRFAEGTSSGYTYFHGSGDYVRYGHHDHLHSMTALTMETWIYRQNNGHFEFMGKNYRNYQFAIRSGNTVRIYKGFGTLSSNTHQSWDTNQFIAANRWYHLAMTWEGNTIRLYIDGNEVWQTNNANEGPIPWFHTQPFEFGRRAGENSQYFQGRLAEARLWNIARTAEDIRDNMYGSLIGNEEGLIGYWPLQDDVQDYSPYGLTGTVVGNVDTEQAGELPYNLFSVPQANYVIGPGETTVVPLTFFNRDDMTSHFFKTRLYSDDPNIQEYDLDIFLEYGETVPSTPVYFTPVAPTGKPYTIVITDAKIDGQTIQVGDEIGVLDGDLCVGAGIFNGTFNFVFDIWENDPGQGLPGYTPGNPMTFKLYKTSADLETNEAEKTYFVGDDTFGFGTFSALALDASVFNIQSLALTGGQFNLVSFNLFPRFANAWTVFGGLESLQIVYNHHGQVLIPEYNINTIGDINFLNGFYLYTDQAETIDYEGTYINPGTWDITVTPNKWNYISMLRRTPVAVTSVFEGFESDISIVQAASGESWIPSQGINTIGNMLPGLGYKIALSGSTPITFNYPASGSKTDVLAERGHSWQSMLPGGSYFNYTQTGLPYAVIMNLRKSPDTFESLLPGDEIALYDGQQCVGSVVYNGSRRFLMNAWRKDDAMNLPGFAAGNLMTAKVYRKSTGTLSRHVIKNMSGGLPVFGDGNYANVLLDLIPADARSSSLNVQPNPFMNHTTVVLDLKQDGYARVNIFDGSGRLIKNLNDKLLTSGIHNFSWDGTDMTGKRIKPGIYFIMAETSETVITEKVIIMQ